MSERTRDQLRAIPLFASLDDVHLQRVAALASEFDVRAGHVLIEKGQGGTGLFVIEDGHVRVDLPKEEHREVGAGSFVGELSLLADVPRTARVVATTDVRGLAISRTALMELLHDDAPLAVAMLREVSRRLAELESSIS